jgi:hypothetical protein
MCKTDLNFKEAKFTKLKTIDRKWKLVFQVIFPEIPEDQIPSPYANKGDALTDVSGVCDGYSDKLYAAFKSRLLEEHRVDILCHIPELVPSLDTCWRDIKRNLENGQDCTKKVPDSSFITEEWSSCPHSTQDPPQSLSDEGYRGMSPRLHDNYSYEQSLCIEPMCNSQLQDMGDAEPALGTTTQYQPDQKIHCVPTPQNNFDGWRMSEEFEFNPHFQSDQAFPEPAYYDRPLLDDLTATKACGDYSDLMGCGLWS